jgi:small subunit ribosomal protein S20
MPITKSAKKALRQNATRHARNVVRKGGVQASGRHLPQARRCKEARGSRKALPLVFKALDKAAKAKVIEKNKASRLKSRLSQLINKSTKASS